MGSCQSWGLSRLSTFLYPNIWSGIKWPCIISDCCYCDAHVCYCRFRTPYSQFSSLKSFWTVKLIHNLLLKPYPCWLPWWVLIYFILFECICRLLAQIWLEVLYRIVYYLSKMWEILYLKTFWGPRFQIRDCEFIYWTKFLPNLVSFKKLVI